MKPIIIYVVKAAATGKIEHIEPEDVMSRDCCSQVNNLNQKKQIIKVELLTSLKKWQLNLIKITK